MELNDDMLVDVSGGNGSPGPKGDSGEILGRCVKCGRRVILSELDALSRCKACQESNMERKGIIK